MLSLWLLSCYPWVEVLYQRANPKWRFRSPGHIVSPLCHGQISYPLSCHFSMKQGLKCHGATGRSNDCNIPKVTAWREPWGMSLSVSTKLYDQGITELSHIQTRRTGKLKWEVSKRTVIAACLKSSWAVCSSRVESMDGPNHPSFPPLQRNLNTHAWLSL